MGRVAVGSAHIDPIVNCNDENQCQESHILQQHTAGATSHVNIHGNDNNIIINDTICSTACCPSIESEIYEHTKLINNMSKDHCGNLVSNQCIHKQYLDNFGFQPFDWRNCQRKLPIYSVSLSGPYDINWLQNAIKIISHTNKPNYLEARIIVPSLLKIPKWRAYLADYWDSMLCEYLEFGFVLDNSRMICSTNQNNHSLAIKHGVHVRKYIADEIRYGAMMGPFENTPLDEYHVSPLMSRPKSDSEDRRIIVDLSWPKGQSLNSCVTEAYDNIDFKLTYPTVDYIADRVRQLGDKALLYKVDLY